MYPSTSPRDNGSSGIARLSQIEGASVEQVEPNRVQVLQLCACDDRQD
jgi:hypothetical protein